MKITLAICGTVIILLIVSAYFFLTATNHPTEQFTAFLTLTVPTMVAAGASVYQTVKNGKNIKEVAEKTDTVIKQTNGPMAKQASQIADIHAALIQDTEVKPNG